MAVVVAHLGGLGEAAAGIAAAARRRQLLAAWIVLDVPRRPVERRLVVDALVAGLEAKQRAIVHAAWPHDLAGIEDAQRIEQALHRLEGLGEPRTELPRDPFRAHQPIAVL